MRIWLDVSVIFSSFLFWSALDNAPFLKNKRFINSELIHAILKWITSNVMCSLYPMFIYEYGLIKYSLPLATRIIPLMSIGYETYDMLLKMNK